MRILLFIFALYITGLSVYPCYEDDCADEYGAVSHEDEQEENGPDMCTPFCISACCSVHVWCPVYPGVSTILRRTINLNSEYTTPFTSTVVISIWQPPKLA